MAVNQFFGYKYSVYQLRLPGCFKVVSYSILLQFVCWRNNKLEVICVPFVQSRVPHHALEKGMSHYYVFL